VSMSTHLENLAAIAEICDGCSTAVHFYGSRKDELARDIRALLAENDQLHEKLKTEILGIPIDVNTVRWANRCLGLIQERLVLRGALQRIEEICDRPSTVWDIASEALQPRA
jgi:hypothetical protein